MTPEARVILVPVAVTVLCAGLVLLAMGLAGGAPWAWWTLGAGIAGALLVAYVWAWTVRERHARWLERYGSSGACVGEHTRRIPLWRIVAWGLEQRRVKEVER